MNLKIAYFVHGRGRGHATRALTLGQMLVSENYEILVFAGRDAFPVLKDQLPTTFIDSVLPSSSPFLFIQRIIGDLRFLRKIKATCVISDGDAPATWAARLLGLHVISIGHGMIFPYGKHPFALNQWALFKESFKVKVATHFSDFKLIVHFCQLDLNIPQAKLVRPSALESTNEVKQDFLVSYFRDGNGATILQHLTNRGQRIINFGRHVDLVGVENRALDQAAFQVCLQQAKGVIGSAGSNLIFEAIALNKPLLLTFKPDDFEQATNAKYVEHLKAGVGFPIGEVNEKKINHFLKLMERGGTSSDQLNNLPQLLNELSQHLERTFCS